MGTQLDAALAYVLVYELLFGKGCRTPVAAPEKYVLTRKTQLKKELAKRMSIAKVTKPEQLLPESVRVGSKLQRSLPRYVRVNTLKCTREEALAGLQRQQAVEDDHVADLLVLPPGTDLHKHPLVLSGGLVLQGKGSCMPAAVLAPESDWEVVDACAAPGNKTTHLAALMQGKGRITAFDADHRRLKRLKANALATGASNIVAKNADFLAVDPCEYPQVRAILLDPSCSGSGTEVVRGDILLRGGGEEKQGAQAAAEQRIEALATFQVSTGWETHIVDFLLWLAPIRAPPFAKTIRCNRYLSADNWWVMPSLLPGGGAEARVEFPRRGARRVLDMLRTPP